MAADVVVFDPTTVADKATFESPFQYPEGIKAVIVNGAIALRERERAKERTGQTVVPGARG
jgi:N-acyl-D-aspartate/D-glutamate deacylase